LESAKNVDFFFHFFVVVRVFVHPHTRVLKAGLLLLLLLREEQEEEEEWSGTEQSSSKPDRLDR